jgi:hypothetical protein
MIAVQKARSVNQTKKSSRFPGFLLIPLRTRTVHIAVASTLTAACARPAAYPPRFDGASGTASVDPGAVREVRNEPSGHVLIGTVTARCRADSGVRTIHSAWLADVDCSEGLLTAALREKAAAVGGRVLVGRECSHHEYSCSDVWKSELVTCSAKVAARSVWRPTKPVGATGKPIPGMPIPRPPAAPVDERVLEVGSPSELPALEYASPHQAFRVKVSFAPVGPVRQFSPRETERVNELAVLSPAHVVMGDIGARCYGECERAAVRYAVRAAAARVGATDVVGISCVRTRVGFSCTGRAARPEADPETNFLAR